MRIWIACILFFLFGSCKGPSTEQRVSALPDNTTQYAVAYRVDSLPGYRLLSIAQQFGDRLVALRWILQDDRSPPCGECEIPEELRALPRIRIPLRKIVALSSTHLALLQELGTLDRVVGISQINLVHSDAIRQAVHHKRVAQVGYGPSIQIEPILALTPDAVITFAVGDTRMDDYTRLMEARVPTVVFAEWLEPHPLGRLEWIRLMGLLVGKETLADSIFRDRVQRYSALARQVANVPSRPVVFIGSPMGDNWHLTGGQSYFARLITDAGGLYLFERDSSRNGFLMDFESLLMHVRRADYWINPGIWNSRREALRSDGRVNLIPAFREGRVLQHNKRRSPEGGDDFWELGMVRPDLLLADLIYFLHPQAVSDDTATFYQILPEEDP